jgi:hypothetical protein
VVALALGLGLGLGLKHHHHSEPSYKHKGPNVIVVMADDQGESTHRWSTVDFLLTSIRHASGFDVSHAEGQAAHWRTRCHVPEALLHSRLVSRLHTLCSNRQTKDALADFCSRCCPSRVNFLTGRAAHNTNGKKSGKALLALRSALTGDSDLRLSAIWWLEEVSR